MKKVFANKRNSFTAERAMFAVGKACMGVLGGGLSAEERKVYRKEGTELLEMLAKKGRHAEFMYKARIMLAIVCHRNGEKERCIMFLASIPESAGEYKKLADWYLGVFQGGC